MSGCEDALSSCDTCEDRDMCEGDCCMVKPEGYPLLDLASEQTVQSGCAGGCSEGSCGVGAGGSCGGSCDESCGNDCSCGSGKEVYKDTGDDRLHTCGNCGRYNMFLRTCGLQGTREVDPNSGCLIDQWLSLKASTPR